MTKGRFAPAYPVELRKRGVRLFRESRADYRSNTAAYRAKAPKLGCSLDILRVWSQQAEREAGRWASLTIADGTLRGLGVGHRNCRMGEHWLD